MGMMQLRSLKNNPTYMAAIIGGALGFALMTYHILVVGDGTSYPLEAVFIGSILAGVLAQLNGGRSKSAGITAATLALLPTFPSVFTPVVYFLETYGIYGIGGATAAAVLFVGFIFLVSVPTGWLGGGIGRWIGNKFTA